MMVGEDRGFAFLELELLDVEEWRRTFVNGRPPFTFLKYPSSPPEKSSLPCKSNILRNDRDRDRHTYNPSPTADAKRKNAKLEIRHVLETKDPLTTSIIILILTTMILIIMVVIIIIIILIIVRTITLMVVVVIQFTNNTRRTIRLGARE